MEHVIHILYLEDDPADAELVQAVLAEDGLLCSINLVQMRDEFETVLRKGETELILADYKLPMYDGLSALYLAHEFFPEIPFIFVSGTIGEEVAIEALTQGATDYVLKQNLSRLPSAIQRALQEARNRREREQAQEALLRSNEMLRAVIEAAPVAIIGMDLEGYVNSVWNPEAEKMFGWSAEEVAGQPLPTVPRDLKDESRRLLEQIGSGMTLDGVEVCRQRRDGTPIDYSIYASPLRQTDGQINGNISILVDITERKRTEEKLFKSNATLTTIFDGISDPLIMLDSTLCVQKLNRTALEYFGVAGSQDAVGKVCYEALRGKTTPCEGCMNPFSELHGYAGSYERRCPHDTSKIEIVTIDVVRDKSGAPQASIVRISDITQAKNIERQLIQNEKLSALGLLIAGIAHEINNPNNLIYFNAPILRSYIQTLLPIVDEYSLTYPDFQPFDQPYSEFREDCLNLLDSVEYGSTRINEIVGNLRDFVHERRGGEKRSVKLNKVVEKGISICLGRIKKNIKTFEVDIPEGDLIVNTSPWAIEQVVVNLLINAAQAADKDDSWIKLSIIAPKEPNNDVIVELADNGCGIEPEIQKKIFDPFFTTKAVGVGTGLGLSISYQLVMELGGRIDVKSEVGKGSIFRLVLPNGSV